MEFYLKFPQINQQVFHVNVILIELEENEKAGTVLFYLSAIKPEIVFPKITSIVQSGIEAKDNDETANQYSMIEYLNLNSKRLAELLTKINQVIK